MNGTNGNARTGRSTTFRLTVLVCAALPLSYAGVLSWQALAGSDHHPAPTAAHAPPASQDELVPTIPTGTAAPGAAAPTGTPPQGTPAAPPAPGSGSPAAPDPNRGPLTGRTVLLDAGHNTGNGKHTTEINRQVDIGNEQKECDTTGTETNAGYSEAEYTLDVSRRARAILQTRGATVVFTQDGDRPWGPCIDERAKIGNDAHADAAISVHGDGAPASGSGFHVILPAKVVAGRADTSAIVDPSRRLGLLLRQDFKAATGEPYADYIAQQGLDTRADLGGLNLSKVPKVFIECGNMRNSGDAQRMTDPQWRQQAAQGIADALTAFLTTTDTPGGTG
ncbi:N-acetylmuramoyl-L-alanine amidase [Kitasatospora sp. MMS16-BH015]|uniref:N-acetylmuramoyl-L-alanine amidase n=1 Tax=Kitasatospora sp. MMS16-BH015 TaxID=2018025 RepID=UPI000CA3A147|nr:N-acetylmuramoyl-L-alanine amidase [Kitasatospora sp. MMS16-BH015]AUG76975.1 N-acetylmuramoyl-L-alanine amidase [Kitasatospora sp. MMS16-BH015]